MEYRKNWNTDDLHADFRRNNLNSGTCHIIEIELALVRFFFFFFFFFVVVVVFLSYPE